MEARESESKAAASSWFGWMPSLPTLSIETVTNTLNSLARIGTIYSQVKQSYAKCTAAIDKIQTGYREIQELLTFVNQSSTIIIDTTKKIQHFPEDIRANLYPRISSVPTLTVNYVRGKQHDMPIYHEHKSFLPVLKKTNSAYAANQLFMQRSADKMLLITEMKEIKISVTEKLYEIRQLSNTLTSAINKVNQIYASISQKIADIQKLLKETQQLAQTTKQEIAQLLKTNNVDTTILDAFNNKLVELNQINLNLSRVDNQLQLMPAHKIVEIVSDRTKLPKDIALFLYQNLNKLNHIINVLSLDVSENVPLAVDKTLEYLDTFLAMYDAGRLFSNSWTQLSSYKFLIRWSDCVVRPVVPYSFIHPQMSKILSAISIMPALAGVFSFSNGTTALLKINYNLLSYNNIKDLPKHIIYKVIAPQVEKIIQQFSSGGDWSRESYAFRANLFLELQHQLMGDAEKFSPLEKTIMNLIYNVAVHSGQGLAQTSTALITPHAVMFAYGWLRPYQSCQEGAVLSMAMLPLIEFAEVMLLREMLGKKALPYLAGKWVANTIDKEIISQIDNRELVNIFRKWLKQQLVNILFNADELEQLRASKLRDPHFVYAPLVQLGIAKLVSQLQQSCNAQAKQLFNIEQITQVKTRPTSIAIDVADQGKKAVTWMRHKAANLPFFKLPLSSTAQNEANSLRNLQR